MFSGESDSYFLSVASMSYGLPGVVVMPVSKVSKEADNAKDNAKDNELFGSVKLYERNSGYQSSFDDVERKRLRLSSSPDFISKSSCDRYRDYKRRFDSADDRSGSLSFPSSFDNNGSSVVVRSDIDKHKGIILGFNEDVKKIKFK